jgi:4-aminobutyrate aminotransferase
MPIGAFVARDSVMTWPAGAHGSTFAGNPICAAAGKATMELIEGGLMENAARMGARLRAGIEQVATEHAGVRDIRGVGLMLGVEFASHQAANAVEQEAFERGLLVLECGEATIRLCPPLIIDEAAVDAAIRLFGEAIAAAARPTEGMEETGG